MAQKGLEILKKRQKYVESVKTIDVLKSMSGFEVKTVNQQT